MRVCRQAIYIGFVLISMDDLRHRFGIGFVPEFGFLEKIVRYMSRLRTPNPSCSYKNLTTELRPLTTDVTEGSQQSEISVG